MSTTTTKASRKPRTKTPKSRPASTSALSHAPVQDVSALTTRLSAFSPQGDYFALLSLAADKHRLRVYDVVTSRSVGEYVADGARVSVLAWTSLDLDSAPEDVQEDAGARKRRKKKSSINVDAMVVDGSTASPKLQLIALGMSNGSLVLFSPSHGRVLRSLSHISSTSSITSITSSLNSASQVWSANSDGVLHLWDVSKSALLGSWATDERTPYSALAERPSEDSIELIAAHHSLHLLSDLSYDGISPQTRNTPTKVASITGHATAVQQLAWLSSAQVISRAEGDRFVSVWQLPEPGAGDGRLVASIPLDSDPRRFRISQVAGRNDILVLAASGKVTLYHLSDESAANKKAKVATLSPQSTIQVSAKAKASPFEVIDVAFDASGPGRVRIVRLVGGVRPIFDSVTYLTSTNEYISTLTITHDDSSLPNGEPSATDTTKRYTEPSSLAVRSGELELGLDASADDLPTRALDGALDADLAELSLGQRLTAIHGFNDPISFDSSSSDEEDEEDAGTAPRQKSRSKRTNGIRGDAGPSIPPTSLTRTLIQALHSSDVRLLETCLAHSDHALITATVRRLPPQLAVPLLDACVERLGRGARAANVKGGGGGASAQRGIGLVKWVKVVLAVHSAHLMTMPDLVARLAALHATLTARLALQESILSLSGRLDMVLAQIELRASAAPAILSAHQAKPTRSKKEVGKYVEGESEDDDEGIDVEEESDEGSVEDVELGGDHDEESDEDDEDEDDEDEGDLVDGLIDNEAEDYEEDSDEDSE